MGGRASRREKLLDAAARRFARTGYAAASMRDIAADAGMQVGSIYYHFASKLELMVAVHDHGIEQLREAVTVALEGTTDPWARLERACAAHLDTLLEGADYYRALIRALPAEAEELREALVRGRDSYEAIFARLIDALPLPADVDRHGLRLMLLGAINWSHTWYRAGGKHPARIAGEFVGLLRRQLEGAGGRPAVAVEVPAWVEHIVEGDRRSIGRAITAVENETPEMEAVLEAIAPARGRAHVVGITGAPGVGKSTLVNALVGQLRKAGRTVGVVAVDPASPRSGGAILGDRVRMGEHGADPGVFVRSVSTRGAVGGLSRAAARVVAVLDAAGKDVVLVETVGAGQSEIDVARIADTCVVVNAPGLGDDVQAIKHGILDIADVMVVNKADLPGADKTAAQLRDAARMSSGPRVPVVRCCATTGEGLAELLAAIDGARSHRSADA